MNTELALATTAQLTMTSREIASMTGKRHDNVMRDIRKTLNDLEKDVLSFEATYLDSQERQQTEYVLDKVLTLTVVTAYSTELRNAIIERWNYLEANQHNQALQSAVQNLQQGFDALLGMYKEQSETLNLVVTYLVEHVSTNTQLSISHETEYESARDNGFSRGYTLTKDEVTRIAYWSATYCQQAKVAVKRQPISKYGERNLYPLYVLDKAFKLFKDGKI